MAETYKPIDVKRATPEEIAAGLSLLNKKRECKHKVKKGRKATTKAGITVSEEKIQAELKGKK